MKCSSLIRISTVCLFLIGCQSSPEPKTHRIVTVPYGTLSDVQSGDMVVKRGYGHLSNMIVKTLREEVPLSHCGVMSRRNDSLFIIHSVAKELTGIDGVQMIRYEEFIKDCIPGYFYIVRYKGTVAENTLVHLSAENYLQKKIPFDYEINYVDTSRVNCSELLLQVLYKATHHDVFKKLDIQEKKVIAFNSLLDTNNFQVIYHR